MQFLTSGLKRITYSKDEDNYRAYFSNDVVLEEFERILAIMKGRGNFNVTDFLNEHDNNSLFRYGNRVFHFRNTKAHIDTYIAKHELNINFILKNRRWVFNCNEEDIRSNEDEYDIEDLF